MIGSSMTQHFISFQRRQPQAPHFPGCGRCGRGSWIGHDAFNAKDLSEPLQCGLLLHLQVGEGASGRLPRGGSGGLSQAL